MNRFRSLIQTRRAPILNASMVGAAGWRLASAVSTAGGVGMLGIGSHAGDDPEALREECRRLETDNAAWGAGFLTYALQRDISPLETVLEHRPVVISLGFGTSARAVRLVRETDAVLLAQVGNTSELRRALDEDVDAVIVRGAEGGGHGRNDLSTLTFLQKAADMTDLPLIAAGGIATPRGVATVFAAGAEAVWVGTRFTVASESTFAEAAKERVVRSGDGDTVYTRVFDVAQRNDWPEEYGGRALSNDFTRRWASAPAELQRLSDDDPLVADRMRRARREGHFDVAPIYAGQASALVERVEPAADIVADLNRYREYLPPHSG